MFTPPTPLLAGYGLELSRPFEGSKCQALVQEDKEFDEGEHP